MERWGGDLGVEDLGVEDRSMREHEAEPKFGYHLYRLVARVREGVTSWGTERCSQKMRRDVVKVCAGHRQLVSRLAENRRRL